MQERRGHLPTWRWAALQIQPMNLVLAGRLYFPACLAPFNLSLCFLDLTDYFLSRIREVFNYNLFKYFLSHLLISSFLGPL